MPETATVTRKNTGNGRGETTRGGFAFAPRVDICETDKELLLYADLPGVKPTDVELRFENGELTLHGKVTPSDNGSRDYWLQEYEIGDFYRVFAIHESIDANKIEAECKNGILTVHMPKVEAVQPRQIAVKA